MDLWTEYEGVIIDSAFSLTKLLQTEGRSAFFSTRNDSGEPVLIRIIECHFDEDEILARWRGVQSLGHSNFLRIDRFGEFQMEDDVTAVYAVFERVEENLGDVLERGHLSPAEAAQIGLSVASALESLHSNGFVHEHIETRNIYAVGNSVKLRSDCVRETPEGEAGAKARQRDIYDLANLLKTVLQGKSRSSTAPCLSLLPAPFDEVVHNGMDGSWGLTEIKAALGQCDLPKISGRKGTPKEHVVAKTVSSAGKATATNASSAMSEVCSPLNCTGRVLESEARSEHSTIPASRPEVLLPGQKPSPMDVPVIFGISEHNFRKWTVAASLLLGVVLLGWMFLHHWLNRQSGAVTQLVPARHASQGPHDAPAQATTSPSASLPAKKMNAHPKMEWRVVAFTYNHEEQARKKAQALAQKHPNLSPAIFSPSGRAPWLVTIGGLLDRDTAYALVRKARNLGLPHDTYAQNYIGR